MNKQISEIVQNGTVFKIVNKEVYIDGKKKLQMVRL